MIQLPRLLDSHFQTRSTLHPSRTSIKRNLYALHTASVILLPKEPAVNVRDWLALYDKNGKAGIFRVSRARPVYGERTELTLKHGFCVLDDDTIKETDGKLTGTAEYIIRELWSKTGVTVAPQYWTLGTFAQTPEMTVEYSNAKLLNVMWDVLKKADGYAFSFDQSTFPWVLSLVRLSDEDACEGRFGRNLSSCTVDVDDSALCTRVYLDDRDGYTDADTVSEWGIVSETLTLPDGADENDAQAYVTAYLREHGQPRVTITLGAADMSHATGESIDRFALGTVCRACLADYGVTVRERIVTVNLPDVYGDPDGVEISMANQTETAGDYLKQLRNNAQKLSDQSVVTSRRVGSVGTALEQTDIELIRTKEELTDTRYRLSRAGLIVDGDAEFVKAFAYQETADLLDERITTAESELIVQAGHIALKASQTEVDDLGERVSQAEINIDGVESQITLKANKIVVDGILSTGLAGVGTLSATTVSGNYGNFDNLSIYGDSVVQHSATLLKSVSISRGTTSIKDFYGEFHTVITSVSLNTETETIVYLST